ncbi:MAG: DUF1800 domain-containing protein, partial [Armatimonadetes bacterium]|nr:DUF1800 domain-containing protein [Armatimonadota bacterium]
MVSVRSDGSGALDGRRHGGALAREAARDASARSGTRMTPEERGIALGAASAALVAVAGCAARDVARRVTGPNWEPAPMPPASTELDRARLTLNRAAFGPAPGELAHVVSIGAPAWIEKQLRDDLDEGPASRWRSAGLETVESVQDAPDRFSSLSDTQLLNELQQAAILRAVYSRRQLHEVMVDFWTNHFNIYALKASGRELLPAFVETVVRPHAMGNFREMLLATARSPAMLSYLDNERNRKGVVNENYARELMELHTVGVRGGYAHTDIRELARILTGWTVAEGFARGQFRYDRAVHDLGAKRVPFLDIVVPPGGDVTEAEAVIGRLARHPSTARYLATKLCRRILGHAPESAVAAAARAYAQSHCAIKPMLRPILLDAL